MSLTPSVSILIPAYNAERWIDQAIESALAQGPDFEVLVLDDGSTDGTLARIKTFADRIRWESSPNRGAPQTRNQLLEYSSAPWIQYLDADDFLLPGKVSRQLAVLKEHPNADVIFGPETIQWWRATVERTTTTFIPEPHDPWRLLALWKLPQTGASIWRRSALEDVGGWHEDQPCCQEHELYLRLLIAGKRLRHRIGGELAAAGTGRRAG
ncbi:MAG: glycosyltransferase family A protein, partial [Pseudomonadota bacterium]